MCGDKPSDSSASPDSQPQVPLELLPLHSTSLLTVLDSEGIIQYESPSVEDIYGYTQGELVGESVADYFHPDDREKVINAFESIVTSDEDTVEAVEYRHKQADGTYTWVESVASAKSMPNGQYVINTRDISDQKQYEQQLECQNQRLDEFAGVVSHDLRNPLTVATGRLELARQESDSEHLTAVATALDRMEALITDVLTLAKQGQKITEVHQVSLEAVSRGCWDVVETTEANLVMEKDIHFDADVNRLEQLFENLFRNAIEHGRPDTTVRVGALSNGRGFFVSDDGSGIPESSRKHVFEMGYSTSQNGTGFGLSIVSEIVAAHNWDIDIRESAAGGARFEVTI